MFISRKLITTIGAAAAAVTIAFIPIFEGTIHQGYFDPVGIPTKCMGDTHNVEVGKKYTQEECVQSLNEQIIAHAGPVLKCTPILEGRAFQLSAAISFAYNIGTTNYCRSTTAKRFNRGDFKGACKAMNENDNGKAQWVTAKGKVLKGLVRRRADERALCELGL